MKTIVTKTLSFLMSFALMTSSMPVSAAPVASAPMPDFVKALTPSENLGFVDSFYKGNTEKPVILIQDLHANYGVQKKIRGLLEFLQPKVAPTGRSMVIGIEGAWGSINVEPMRAEKEQIRQATADFLLEKSEISAMEHFAILAESPVRLMGIDDPDQYMVHTELFRQSLAARLNLAKKSDQLRHAISESKTQAPGSLRKIWKLEEDLQAGRIDLETLSKKLNAKVSNYKEAEFALAKAKKALVNQHQSQEGFFLRNIVEADQNLSLLSRLLRQQLTVEEVQYATKRVPAMLMTVRAMLPGENIKLWEDSIRAAIDHYAVALLRDRPMAEHALELAQNNSGSSIVIVAGGFHAAGVSNFLKARKVSHMVIAPIVESHTTKDEEVYVKRIMDIHVSDAEIAEAMPRRLGASTLQFMGIPTINSDNRGAQMYPQRASVWSWVASKFASGRAIPAASAATAEKAAAIHDLVEVAPVVTPGLRARLTRGFLRLINKPVPEMQIPLATQEAVVSVPLAPQPAAAPQGSRSRIGKSLGFTAGTASAILAMVPVEALAQGAASTSSGPSTALVAGVIGGAVALSAAAYALIPKKNRERVLTGAEKTREFLRSA